MKNIKLEKRQFTSNHRTNYISQNKSTIFDPIKGENTKSSINYPTPDTTFTPKYREQTPYERKLKEFWNKKESGKEYTPTVKSTIGFIKKQEAEKSEIISKKSKTINIKSRLNKTQSSNLYSSTQSHRERRNNELYNTNIFNDDNKRELIPLLLISQNKN